MSISRSHRGRAGVLSFLILTLLFVSVGLGVIQLFGQDIFLVGSRDGGRCEIIHVGLFGKTVVKESFPVDGLLGAWVSEVESSVSDSSDNNGFDGEGQPTYRTIIDTDQGTLSLGKLASSGRAQHEQNVATINAFIQGQIDDLYVKQSGGWMRGIGFIFLGLAVLMFLGMLATLARGAVRFVKLFQRG